MSESVLYFNIYLALLLSIKKLENYIKKNQNSQFCNHKQYNMSIWSCFLIFIFYFWQIKSGEYPENVFRDTWHPKSVVVFFVISTIARKRKFLFNTSFEYNFWFKKKKNFFLINPCLIEVFFNVFLQDPIIQETQYVSNKN